MMIGTYEVHGARCGTSIQRPAGERRAERRRGDGVRRDPARRRPAGPRLHVPGAARSTGRPPSTAAAVYSWGPITATATNADAQGDGWSRYNFEGYEGRDQYYTEYYDVVHHDGADSATTRTTGAAGRCGRTSGDNGQYGTTMALMLLPHWTDGCIGSMEGLFFEASGTTPYHFLTDRGDVEAVVEPGARAALHRQRRRRSASVTSRTSASGTRWCAPTRRRPKRRNQPELTLVATSTPWDIYLVADSDVVVAARTQPVVVDERLGDGTARRHARALPRDSARAGSSIPTSGRRCRPTTVPTSGSASTSRPTCRRRLGEGDPNGPPGRHRGARRRRSRRFRCPTVDGQQRRASGRNSIAFDVDQVGVPVLVKVSYFPNWNASGADGPFRIGPNMMVVVPHRHPRRADYGRSAIDYLTILLTLIGIGLCFVVAQGRRHRSMPGRSRRFQSAGTTHDRRRRPGRGRSAIDRDDGADDRIDRSAD